jgi:VRR-NUC domain
MINPVSLAKESESSHQTALFAWAAIAKRDHTCLAWMHAIKNEERSGSVIAGAKSKAMGVKAGVADIFLPFAASGFHGLYIELKTNAGKQSDKQKAFEEYVISRGYAYVLCRGWDQARQTIEKYLANKLVLSSGKILIDTD